MWTWGWYFCNTPLWMAAVMAPLTVAAEWPRLRYIDDNATMILIPLAGVVLLHRLVAGVNKRRARCSSPYAEYMLRVRRACCV